jgi:hypothetical protein
MEKAGNPNYKSDTVNLLTWMTITRAPGQHQNLPQRPSMPASNAEAYRGAFITSKWICKILALVDYFVLQMMNAPL